MRVTDANDTARRFRAWVDGTLVEDRAYTAEENAAVDAVAVARNRETNRTILLDRAAAALAANTTAIAALTPLETQVSFNNTQRDQALRDLARQVVTLSKENNALIRLLVGATRPNTLDSTE